MTRDEGATAESADATVGEGILTVTSATLGDPRGDDAEKDTSDDDGNGESDQSQP